MLVSIWKCKNCSEWQLKPVWQIHWHSLFCQWTNRRCQDRPISAGEISHCLPSVYLLLTFCLVWIIVFHKKYLNHWFWYFLFNFTETVALMSFFRADWSEILMSWNWTRIVSNTQCSHASWKVLKIPGILFVKFAGPGKSWKMGLVLESPGNFSWKSWNFLLGYDAGGGHNGVGADAKICACAVRTSLASNK